jgi:hypothetical protein
MESSNVRGPSDISSVPSESEYKETSANDMWVPFSQIDDNRQHSCEVHIIALLMDASLLSRRSFYDEEWDPLNDPVDEDDERSSDEVSAQNLGSGIKQSCGKNVSS